MNIKKAAATLALTLAIAMAGAADKADPNGNMIGLKTANGKIAYDFINMWFNEHKAEAAWDKYVARKGYMNHAVYSATTKTVDHTFDQEKAEEKRAAGPNTHFEFKQLIAQGNLVFAHIAATNGQGGVGPATGEPSQGALQPEPGARGGRGPGGGPSGDGKGPDEMLMILRVHKGKIVDHWDVHVPTNSDSVVFEGLDRELP